MMTMLLARSTVLIQVKDIPTMKWPAAKGALYTVVMAGK